MPRVPIHYFVSYAHSDRTTADPLIEGLETQLAPSARYGFRRVDDRGILPGELWRRRIEDGIAQSDFGLLLVSPAFLASAFIATHELPHFAGAGARPSIPVELESVHTGMHDLRGLEQQQLFRLDEKPYGKCNRRARQRFVEQLAWQIEQRLAGLGRGAPSHA